MNKKWKMLFVIVLVIFEVLFVAKEVFGVSGAGLVSQFNGSNVGAGNAGVNTSEGENLINSIIGPILSVVRIVAIGVIMISYLGFKYMAAAPTEKASIKNQLVVFTVGFAIVVGATTILKMLHSAATNLTK